MNLYYISQDVNLEYDTYSDAVVCARTAEEARMIHPDPTNLEWDGIFRDYDYDTWCPAKDVKVELIGFAISKLKKGVICSSFHAG